MTVVTFKSVIPPERHPPIVTPWNRVEVEEAPFQDGPWTALPTMITLDPLDADPTQPQPRDFSTTEATLTSGWYRVVFYDADDNFSDPSEAVLNAPSYVLPTVRQVADKLITRTRTRGGALAGTFNSETNPDDDRVQRLIGQAYDVVYSRIGTLNDFELVRDAAELIRIYTAMSIELSHYPEQIRDRQSPYLELKKLFDAGMAALIEGSGGTGGSGADNVSANMPNYDFPETAIGDGIMP